MAIGTDSTIEFFGTETEVSNVASPGTIASDAFSDSANDIDTWANSDDAPFASFKLDCSFGTAPTAGEAVHLYAQLIDIESTTDTPNADANFLQYYLGAFVVDAVTTQQLLALTNVRLPNYEASQTYRFWIENATSQQMDADWSLWVTPKTFGPHA